MYKIVFDPFTDVELMTINADGYLEAGYVLLNDSLLYPIIYSPQVRYV